MRPISKKESAGVVKIMLLLILISLLLAAGFLLVYLWAARNGQFDDDYTPSVRILFDDSPPGAVREGKPGIAETDSPLPAAEPETDEKITSKTK